MSSELWYLPVKKILNVAGGGKRRLTVGGFTMIPPFQNNSGNVANF